MSFYETPICDSLKKYMSFRTEQDLNEYFLSITDDGFNWVIKCPWLDRNSYAAMQNFREEWSGRYIAGNKTKPTVFIIPKANQGIDSEPTYKDVKNEIPEDEKPYNLEKSMKGIGQLCPVLTDAHGNIIDGFHRKEVDRRWPEMKVGQITNTVQLELARLATNYCRRLMGKEELDEKIGFLIGAGLKPIDIVAATGISESTIYRHMPEQLKDEKLSKAQKEGWKEKPKTDELCFADEKPTVKTQDSIVETPAFKSAQEEIATQLTKCEACLKPVYRTNLKIAGGKLVCPQCRGEKPKVEVTKEPEAPPKKLYKETAEYRDALMHPQKSQFELGVIQDLQTEGIPLETDVQICAVETVPDAIHRAKQVAIYLDNEEVHKNRIDRDEWIRDRIEKHKGWHICSLPWKADTKQEREKAKQSIRDFLKLVEL